MAEETGVKIDTSELESALDCTVCYTNYKEPMMTKCGHTYCRACIEACIMRNHECPECKTQLKESDLTRNIQIERLQRQLVDLREKAKRDPMSDFLEADGSKFMKSPVVSVFQTNLKECLLKFEKYCDDIKREMEECKKKIKARYAMRLLKESQGHVDPTKFAQLKAEEAKEIAAIDEKCTQTLNSLIQSYDRYMREAVPEPKIETIKVVIRAPTKNVRLDNVLLRPFDTFREARLLVEKQLEAVHNPVLKWGADVRYVVILGVGGGARGEEGKQGRAEVVSIAEEMTPLSRLPVPNNSEIQLVGTITCVEDCPKPCMTLQFNKDAKKAYNYFSCDTCSLNWICEACAQQCHKGHAIKDYLKSHVPTWACCYCAKKKCTIPNKTNPYESVALN